MAAMPKSKIISNKEIYRPFLNISKEIIIKYAKKHKLKSIEDESNNNKEIPYGQCACRHGTIKEYEISFENTEISTITIIPKESWR